MKNRTKGIVKMVSAAMLALLGLGGWAQTARATGDSGDSASDQGSTVPGPINKGKHELTGTVSSIDKATSSMSIRDQRGNLTSVQVPDDVKNLQEFKPGDTVSVAYKESVAVGISRPGQTMAEMKKGAKANEPGGYSCGGVTEVSGNIVSIDQDKGQLTFRAAGGDIRTVSASEFPAVQNKLSTLRPGDIVQVAFTQPVATKIAKKQHLQRD